MQPFFLLLCVYTDLHITSIILPIFLAKNADYAMVVGGYVRTLGLITISCLSILKQNLKLYFFYFSANNSKDDLQGFEPRMVKGVDVYVVQTISR